MFPINEVSCLLVRNNARMRRSFIIDILKQTIFVEDIIFGTGSGNDCGYAIYQL